MEQKNKLTLGSLFDGSGGFPLGGLLAGIKPVWASEIEPYPIAVTRSRFPHMKHYGDVSIMRGAELEPVDIVTFGSPCQDMSIAGKREGLKHEAQGDEETTRSGLFYEAVRIVKEMRCATNGKYPKYAVWENVPGAFSSNKGYDFHAVLEALCSVRDSTVSIPKPYDAKRANQLVWSRAGEIVGDNYSIAWRTLDAQYWGVPQRRKRIYLVADFTGRCAGEILFKPEGRIRDSSEGRKTRKSFTINAMGCTDGTNRNGGMIYGQEEATNAREILSEVRGAIGAESLEEWLRGTVTFFQRAEILQFEMCQSEDREKPNNNGELPSNGKRYIPGNDVLCGLQKDLKNGNTPHRQEPIEQLTEQFGEIVQKLSLKTTQEQSSLLDLWKTSESKRFLPTSLFRVSEPFKNGETFSRRYGKSVAVTADAVGSVDGSNGSGGQLAATLISSYGTKWNGNAGAYNGENFVLQKHSVDGSVGAAGMSGNNQFVIALQANGIDRADTAGCNGCGWRENESYTLNTIDRHAVCFEPGAMVRDMGNRIWEEQSPTLRANMGDNQTAVCYGIDQQGGKGGANFSENTMPPMCSDSHGTPHAVCFEPGAMLRDMGNRAWDEQSPTIRANMGDNQPAVCYDARGNGDGETACFTMQRSDEYQACNVASTQSARQYKSATDLVVEKKRRYIIRRLTPTECARLQGFPDDWGHLAPYNPDDAEFWEDVRKTHAEINGKVYKPVKNLKAWYEKLRNDGAEYKMWGNGIALPCAAHVLRGIVLNERRPHD